jgi:hypothetical protein
MLSIIIAAIGLVVFVASHLAIYFVRNILRGAAFAVVMITLLSLGISGDLPLVSITTAKWIGILTVAYAAVVAVFGVFVTAYEIRKYMAKEEAGQDTWIERINLKKVVYNVPNWSFRNNIK